MTYSELMELSERDLSSRISELLPKVLQDEKLLINIVKEMKEWERVHNPSGKDVNGVGYTEMSKRTLSALNSLDTHEGIELFKNIENETGRDLIEHILLATIATHKVRDTNKT